MLLPRIEFAPVFIVKEHFVSKAGAGSWLDPEWSAATESQASFIHQGASGKRWTASVHRQQQ